MARTFSALVVARQSDGVFRRDVAARSESDLPPGDLLVQVSFSSLNYKDALAAIGRRGVAREYPLTPGIDAAGVVVESSAADFRPGDPVIVMGHELGTAVPGGFGQLIRVPAAWALALPTGLTLRQSMILGTAGFTAALAVRSLQESGVPPHGGEVLVTGATGGVGCIAVAILSRLGYGVAAGTGKTDRRAFLESLGARRVVPRAELDDGSGKALLPERWAAVIDTVGGGILSTAIRSTAYGGTVAACGNAASADLPVTVFPFILRGVRLLGIESSRCPSAVRRALWERLCGAWKPLQLSQLAEECTLDELGGKIDDMMAGRLTGRVLVNLEGREP